jgi:alcohol dehydrogenase class IV
VCAALLPHVMDANLRALRTRAGDHRALHRFAKVAAMLTGKPHATADEGVEWVRALGADLQIPRLSAYGIGADDFDEIARRAARASSMKGNPIELTAPERMEILSAAF